MQATLSGTRNGVITSVAIICVPSGSAAHQRQREQVVDLARPGPETEHSEHDASTARIDRSSRSRSSTRWEMKVSCALTRAKPGRRRLRPRRASGEQPSRRRRGSRRCGSEHADTSASATRASGAPRSRSRRSAAGSGRCRLRSVQRSSPTARSLRGRPRLHRLLDRFRRVLERATGVSSARRAPSRG